MDFINCVYLQSFPIDSCTFTQVRCMVLLIIGFKVNISVAAILHTTWSILLNFVYVSVLQLQMSVMACIYYFHD